jgi:hypothetical protein
VTGVSDTAWWEPCDAAAVGRLLGHRRWWRCRRPFPHVRAVNVFRSSVYSELEGAFSDWLDESGGGPGLDAHDLQGTTVTRRFEGPLRVFASAGWRELLRRALGVSVTPHVNLGLHHHRPHSEPGFAHTDLNPAWFPDDAEEVVLADPASIDYTTGRVWDSSVNPIQVVRAVAVLFYIANPPWQPQHENCTGLYHSGRDDPGEPVTVVQPHSNSLLAFECTPWSFHGFVRGGSVGRNSIVQWLHRTPGAAHARWGSTAVVGYSGRPR